MSHSNRLTLEIAWLSFSACHLYQLKKQGYILTSLTCPLFFHRLFHIYKIKNGHLNFWSGNMPELSD